MAIRVHVGSAELFSAARLLYQYKAGQSLSETMMKKWFNCLVSLGFLFPVLSIRAQAVYTGSKAPLVEAGAGLLYLNNDYTPKSNQGLSAWVDANLNRYVGLEAEAHLGVLESPADYGENSYLVGPKFSVHQGKSDLYAKALMGRGDLVNDAPEHVTTASYLVYAFGGGLEYRVRPNWKIRLVDAETQTWTQFKPHGLTPYTISSGFMYSFH